MHSPLTENPPLSQIPRELCALKLKALPGGQGEKSCGDRHTHRGVKG